ncbi:MAG: hypothetical protein ACI8RN_002978, partial [Glaciecola sp.]
DSLTKHQHRAECQGETPAEADRWLMQADKSRHWIDRCGSHWLTGLLRIKALYGPR